MLLRHGVFMCDRCHLRSRGYLRCLLVQEFRTPSLTDCTQFCQSERRPLDDVGIRRREMQLNEVEEHYWTRCGSNNIVVVVLRVAVYCTVQAAASMPRRFCSKRLGMQSPDRLNQKKLEEIARRQRWWAA